MQLITAISVSPLNKKILVIVMTSDANLINSARAACESATFDTFENITKVFRGREEGERRERGDQVEGKGGGWENTNTSSR